MKIEFTKTHGAGNDFIIIYNNQHHKVLSSPNFIQQICNRKIGVGADGLILLSDTDQYDYRMDYYNNDGTWETACANGARCAALLMYVKGQCGKEVYFIMGDGPHEAQIINENEIILSMRPPIYKTDIISLHGFHGRYVDSGAKHFVIMTDNFSFDDVTKIGRQISFDPVFKPHGVNVNFISRINKNTVKVLTYEKGIESMVLSCGSGSVASVFHISHISNLESPVQIINPGGQLMLKFDKKWQDVWLSGPAHLSFQSNWHLKIK